MITIKNEMNYIKLTICKEYEKVHLKTSQVLTLEDSINLLKCLKESIQECKRINGGV